MFSIVLAINRAIEMGEHHKLKHKLCVLNSDKLSLHHSNTIACSFGGRSLIIWVLAAAGIGLAYGIVFMSPYASLSYNTGVGLYQLDTHTVSHWRKCSND